MSEELNKLINLIEEHFKNCIWNSRPPLKEVDFQLIILSQQIINLRDNLGILKLNEVNIEIKKLMTFMEETFNIPLLDEDCQNKIRRNLLLKIYNDLSYLKVD